MHPGLAQAIKSQAGFVKEIFTDRFQTDRQWCNYMLEHYGGTMSVKPILDRGDGWSAQDFHALFIACWIYYPLEKGSYMIPLTSTQRANVKSGYSKLDKRWTSHLHEHGRSAATGWSFLKGYHELLVQMEGGGKHTAEIEPHLFLKAEGHTAFTPAHLKSFFTKLKTGHGEVANAALQALAQHKQSTLGVGNDLDDVGIDERAAENYSNSYKALLKTMAFKGKITTVHEAVASMYLQCTAAMGSNVKPDLPLALLVARAGLQGKMAERGVGDMDNADVAKMIEDVLIPFGRSAQGLNFNDPQLKAFLVALVAAETDLKQVAMHLRTDAARTGQDRTVRYFQEIVVSPHALGLGLDAAYKMLSGK